MTLAKLLKQKSSPFKHIYNGSATSVPSFVQINAKVYVEGVEKTKQELSEDNDARRAATITK